MPLRNTNPSPLPYADVAESVLNLIYDSLHIIYRSRFISEDEDRMLDRLAKRADRITNETWAKPTITRCNPHLLDGINKNTRVPGEIPRISRLCLEAVNGLHNPNRQNEEELRGGIFVPSPLAILVDSLTIPLRPESSVYGFALARALLFSHYQVHTPAMGVDPTWEILSISDIQEGIENFRTYIKKRDNIHHSWSKKTNGFLAQFLGMQGVFVLRFGTSGKKHLARTAEAQNACLNYLKAKQFLSKGNTEKPKYEFRLAPNLTDIPDTQETLNSLLGVPLQIAGASTVFLGGLQRSHRESLVLSVSGPPGSGKTSFALALSASLAPFGTRTLYCSFEEDIETLTRRALGLVPQYFRRTTLPYLDEAKWLSAVPLDPTIVSGVENFATNYMIHLKERLDELEGTRQGSTDSLPAVAPLLVVIDSLTALLGETGTHRLDEFCTFIRYLRDLKCIVVLLSAEDIPKDSRLEYLVDSVINFRHEGTDSAEKMPFRLFQLVKTRLQMSRPGSHLLHLSGQAGLRLSPQLPSLLDSHEIHKRPLPDRSLVIDVLREEQNGSKVITGEQSSRLIDLYPGSRILIHGHGSSGKSSLALRILTAPVQHTGTDSGVRHAGHKKPKILVISFLYPADYYSTSLKRFSRVRKNTKSDNGAPFLQVMALTPGYLGPDEFVSMVLLEINKARLEGSPFTGVLLDGLHNTFLQFPALQESKLVWPALYSLLTPHNLTIVTTFTSFTHSQSPRAGRQQDDEDLILKGQLPFLHVIVQATDFYLEVEPRDIRCHDQNFTIEVKSAIYQRMPGRTLIWNAEQLNFTRFEALSQNHQLELSLVK